MNAAPANPQRHTRGRSAFALAEVLVAVALMSVAFVSLYLGISTSFAITQVSRENLRATQIMLERMEGIRLYNWNQLVYSNMIPSNFVAYYYPAGKLGESKGIAYGGTINIGAANLNPSASYSDRMRAITVTVSWTNSNGGNQKIVRQRSMTTYTARDGVQNYVINN
jgi:Tfp pilus assembly protein PilV